MQCRHPATLAPVIVVAAIALSATACGSNSQGSADPSASGGPPAQARMRQAVRGRYLPANSGRSGQTAAAVMKPATLNCAPPGVKQVLCYSPQAYEVAYGVAPLLSHGIDGIGEK